MVLERNSYICESIELRSHNKFNRSRYRRQNTQINFFGLEGLKTNVSGKNLTSFFHPTHNCFHPNMTTHRLRGEYYWSYCITHNISPTDVRRVCLESSCRVRLNASRNQVVGNLYEISFFDRSFRFHSTLIVISVHRVFRTTINLKLSTVPR